MKTIDKSKSLAAQFETYEEFMEWRKGKMQRVISEAEIKEEAKVQVYKANGLKTMGDLLELDSRKKTQIYDGIVGEVAALKKKYQRENDAAERFNKSLPNWLTADMETWKRRAENAERDAAQRALESQPLY